jgi:hypothetical protein
VGGFPQTSVLDTFTGANGDDLPTYSGNWSATTVWTNLEIQSNTAAGTSAAALNFNYWNVSDFGPNCEVFVTITTYPAIGVIAFLRLVQETDSTTIDGYYILPAVVGGASNDTINILRFDNGIGTVLGADIVQEFVGGDQVGLRVVGSDLTCYYNATALATRSDATYGAAGKIALATLFDTTVRLDSFGGGTL